MGSDYSERRGTRAIDSTLRGRGTLGVSKEARLGFETIRLRFELDTDAPSEQIERLVALTERYGVVAQTILSAKPMAPTVRVKK